MSAGDKFAACVAFGIAVFIWLDELLALGRKLFRQKMLIAALAFVSRPLVWVGEWLNDRADAKTERLWRTCPWCGHDADLVYQRSSDMCGSTWNNKTLGGVCLCHEHGPRAWHRLAASA